MTFAELFTHPIIISAYALLIGSFLNVCIFRIPFGRPKGLASLEADEDEVEKQLKEMKNKINIFFPRRSFCPHCKETLLWWHNIPLFSWLLLRGRCHFCKGTIPFRYPLVELLSLIMALLCYYHFNGWTAVILYFLSCALIVESFIDIDYFIIPNIITFPGIGIGLLLALINTQFHVFDFPLAKDIWQSLIGLAIGGGFLFVIAEAYYLIKKKVGLGFGDVKLMALAGVFFGWMFCLQAIFIGSLLGTVIGLTQIALSKGDGQTPIPFGPYLALGIITTMFLIKPGMLTLLPL